MKWRVDNLIKRYDTIHGDPEILYSILSNTLKNSGFWLSLQDFEDAIIFEKECVTIKIMKKGLPRVGVEESLGDILAKKIVYNTLEIDGMYVPRKSF